MTDRREILARRKNGEEFPAAVSIARSDLAGKTVFVAVLKDLTEQRRAEQALNEIQRDRELILSSAGEGIYGLDREGLTTFVNHAAAEMLGWDPDELLGKSQHAVIHHSHPDGSPYAAEDCPIYAAFSDGAAHQVDDEVFWRKDGTSFPVDYVSTPICHPEDGLIGAVVTFRDITERKTAEDALQNAMTELEVLKDRLVEENVYLQDEIKLNHRFDEILGASAQLRQVLHKVEQVAPTPTTVLILGETGTGKELFARAIHDLSDRKDRPLVKVNCAALPAGIVESELFGHEKGAFTGASSKRTGRFALADGGTIFLDEIGDLPMDTQAKLLRVLQEGEFELVGGEKTMKVDVRVIAATNRDLGEAIRTGDFRTDLYYRLAVFPISIPPLRERQEDIPELVKLFVSRFGKSIGKHVTAIPHDVMAALQDHTWPGNIRELQNMVERLVILTPDATLRLDDTFEGSRPGPVDVGFASGEALEDVEREHIRSVLEKVDWRVAGEGGAAGRLKMNPSTLRSRMAKLGIKRSGQGG
ncbi:MAG: sigma 54-interacting transcriptional regulator [Gemmatimonadetes bacterium]|nr:sigma 54-interacting transcriptional regulator [Gemmatimonadota bacterium]